MRTIQLLVVALGLSLGAGCVVEDHHHRTPPGHAKKRSHSGGDHDRGHGNDPGKYDPDNPGKGKKKKR